MCAWSQLSQLLKTVSEQSNLSFVCRMRAQTWYRSVSYCGHCLSLSSSRSVHPLPNCLQTVCWITLHQAATAQFFRADARSCRWASAAVAPTADFPRTNWIPSEHTEDGRAVIVAFGLVCSAICLPCLLAVYSAQALCCTNHSCRMNHFAVPVWLPFTRPTTAICLLPCFRVLFTCLR